MGADFVLEDSIVLLRKDRLHTVVPMECQYIQYCFNLTWQNSCAINTEKQLPAGALSHTVGKAFPDGVLIVKNVTPTEDWHQQSF